MESLLLKDLDRAKLFNEFGNDDYESQSLINGNTTGIANLNNIRYSWVNPLYREMTGNFWLPEKVKMTSDKITINQLDEAELLATKDTLSFLIFLDNFQVANLPNISEYITCPSVRNLLTIQAFQEVIHSAAYQYILEALFPTLQRDEIYNRWRNNPALLKRNKSTTKIAEEFKLNPSLLNFKKVILQNYILEGVYFYQGFNFFDQLAHRSKLVQTDKQIDYIRTDELTHMGIFINLIKDIFTFDAADKKLIYDTMEESIAIETEWNHSVYGNNILGITTKSSEQYLQFIGDDRLNRIGLEKIYNVENPYSHIENSKKRGGTRGNFFEAAAITEYDTAESVGGWDEL